MVRDVLWLLATLSVFAVGTILLAAGADYLVWAVSCWAIGIGLTAWFMNKKHHAKMNRPVTKIMDFSKAPDTSEASDKRRVA